MHTYFKNLNGLRFIAALAVLFHHAYFFKSTYSPTNRFLDDCFSQSCGRLAVSFFFILSGFLISHLLLVEKDTEKDISYKAFYMRRILRIWPLYLGYGLFLTFLSPYISSKLGLGGNVALPAILINLVFLLFFAVNFQLAFVGENKGIFEISWSVCIEEQFYLIWPILINNFRKRLVGLLIVMYAITILFRLLFYFVFPVLFPSHSTWYFMVANYLMLTDKFDFFGSGLCLAVLYKNRERYAHALNFIFNKVIQVIMIFLAIAYTFSFFHVFTDYVFLVFFDHFICIILFGYVIFSAIQPNSVLRLEYPLVKLLGKISYGIYMFHTTICQLVFIMFKRFVKHPQIHFIYDWVYPVSAFAATAFVAWLSYKFYESPFLSLKNKFGPKKLKLTAAI